MFKVGDRVRVSTNANPFMPKGTVGTVTQIPTNTSVYPIYTIMPDTGTAEYGIWPPDLEPEFNLPTGWAQTTPDPYAHTNAIYGSVDEYADGLAALRKEGARDGFEDLSVDSRCVRPGKQCDCGGLKTYGSADAMFHSNWCGSLK